MFKFKWSYLRKTSVKNEKIVCVQKKKAYKFETLKCILEKTVTLLETL